MGLCVYLSWSKGLCVVHTFHFEKNQSLYNVICTKNREYIFSWVVLFE